jgi:hypothetical protein
MNVSVLDSARFSPLITHSCSMYCILYSFHKYSRYKNCLSNSS